MPKKYSLKETANAEANWKRKREKRNWRRYQLGIGHYQFFLKTLIKVLLEEINAMSLGNRIRLLEVEN